jgi:hypothetical protein
VALREHAKRGFLGREVRSERDRTFGVDMQIAGEGTMDLFAFSAFFAAGFGGK